MSIEAMKQALEALKWASDQTEPETNDHCMCPICKAIDGLIQAIAEAEKQEPVAWGVDWGKAGDTPCVSIIKRKADGGIEVMAVEYAPYTHPQPKLPPPPECQTEAEKTAYAFGWFKALESKREWVGLTDEEIDQGLLRSDYALQTAHAWRAGVVFAMTQLKEKNT